MAIKMISLPDELNYKLKLEENASALICKLLTGYYSSIEETKADDAKDLFTQLEDNNKTIIKDTANEKLKEAIISELDKPVEVEDDN